MRGIRNAERSVRIRQRAPIYNSMKIILTDKDFKFDWFSGQGSGGQHRNKHQNCLRLTHIESGIVAQGTESRSRVDNQRKAFERMVEKLKEWYEKQQVPVSSISDEVIRTYHAERNEVKDHVSGFRQSYKDVVKDGDISDMIEARRKQID